MVNYGPIQGDPEVPYSTAPPSIAGRPQWSLPQLFFTHPSSCSLPIPAAVFPLPCGRPPVVHLPAQGSHGDGWRWLGCEDVNVVQAFSGGYCTCGGFYHFYPPSGIDTGHCYSIWRGRGRRRPHRRHRPTRHGASSEEQDSEGNGGTASPGPRASDDGVPPALLCPCVLDWSDPAGREEDN